MRSVALLPSPLSPFWSPPLPVRPATVDSVCVDFKLSPGRWPADVESATNLAIDRFKLRQLGWQGFDKLPWVCDLRQRYPDMHTIADRASTQQPYDYLEAVRKLLSTAQPGDGQGLEDYFVGRLGLEDLSCRLSGPASGLCDKKGAFVQIFDLLQSLTH